MAQSYLIVETEGPFKSTLSGIKLAVELAHQQCQVKVWFMQEAIQLLQMKEDTILKMLIESSRQTANITLFADIFSLRQQGYNPAEINIEGIKIGDENLLAEHLMLKDVKAIWH